MAIFAGNDVYAAHGELVLELKDRALIARDFSAGEQAGIAAPEGHKRVATFGNAGQSSTWLTLAASAQIKHFVVWQMARHLGLDKGRLLKQANRLGSARDAQHRAANQRHRAASCCCGFDCRQNASHVGSKARHSHFALLLCDSLKQAVADTSFRTCFAFGEHIGAVADHGQNAIIANLAYTGAIGLFPDQRINVDLPVARMHHRAQRRMDRKAVWLSDRVG